MFSGTGSGSGSGTGRPLAIVDGDRHLHLVVPGHAPEALPGDVDLAGFATADQLVLATSDGKVMVHDVARGQRSLLVERPAPLLGLAWGRGHHAWVAAAFGDGTLWRQNLATGATQTAARVPPLDPAHPAARDSKILIGPDGDVLYLHDHEIRAWRADGELAPFATAAKPLEDLGEAGTDHVVAIASDTTTYSVARTGGPLVESLASIEASSAAMAPDSGVLVAIERGALEILDPVVRQRWTLAWPNGVTFQDPAISADGHRVVASTGQSLLAWTIELPASADATARWLDAMTNAVDDPSPGSLGWR